MENSVGGTDGRIQATHLRRLTDRRHLAWIPILTGRFGLAFGVCAGLALGVLATLATLNSNIIPRVEARASAWLATRLPRTDTMAVGWGRVETGLISLDIAKIPLGEMESPMSTGGSIHPFGNGLIMSTARGRMGFLDLETARISYSDTFAPMNEAGLDDIDAYGQSLFSPPKFRVNDILVTRTATGRRVLLMNHHVVEGDKICTAVSSVGLDLVDGMPQYEGDWKRVYTVRPCVTLADVNFNFEGHKSGGRMVESSPGRVLMVVGDYGFGGGLLELGDEINAHDDWDLTRVLDIDIETGEAREFARGLRSPAALLADSSGRLWSSESGPQGGDELNLIVEGGHYGWPNVTYGMGYGDGVAPRKSVRLNPSQGRHEDFERPALAFVPSIAPSQILEVPPDSETFRAWRGDLLMGSLRGQSLYHIRLDGDRVVYAEPIPLGHRLRDLAWLPDGRIAIMADENVILLLRDPEATDGNADEIRIAGYDRVHEMEPYHDPSDNSWKRELFSVRCGTCHSINGSDNIGPSLTGVIGRPIGSVEGYPYSSDLANAQGRWTRAKIKKFMHDPAAAGFPGSSMPPIQDYGGDVILNGIIDFANQPDI